MGFVTIVTIWSLWLQGILTQLSGVYSCFKICKIKFYYNIPIAHRLEKEIDLVSPNSEERLRILQSILEPTPNSISVPDLSELAWRAHGYVAGDLKMVVREGTLNMLMRMENNLSGAKIEIQDLQEGLKKVSIYPWFENT